MADQFGSAVQLWGNEASVVWLLTVLHFLWQGAVIGALATIVGNLLRGASAQSRYITYSAAIISLPVCMAITFFVVNVPSRVPSTLHPEIVTGVSTKSPELPSHAVATLAARELEITANTNAIPRHEPGMATAAEMKLVAERDAVSLSPSSLTMFARVAPWVTVAYAIGVACFLLRLLTALWGGHRLRTAISPLADANLLDLIADQAQRMQLKSAPVVAYCERVAVPTIVGMLRPIILLPVPLMSALTADEFSGIIRHEFAHIRRYDLWVNLLQRVIEAILFFHPVVWFISRRLSAEREVCCDDLVVSADYQPIDYAGALLRMAEMCTTSQRSNGLTLTATGGKASLLERRIERMINWGHAPNVQMTRTGVAGFLMILVSLIALPGMARTWARVAEPNDDVALRDQAQPINSDNEGTKEQPPQTPKPITVVTEPVRFTITNPQALTLTQPFIAQIHAHRHIKIRALEKGHLQIAVNDGQRVKEGDLLCKVVPIRDQKNSDLAKFNTITAPYDGIVGHLRHQQASLVEEGENLTTLSDDSVMWIYFNVPRTRYLEYAQSEHQGALKVELLLTTGKKFDQVGKIGEIQGDFKNETGEIAIRADFPNPDRLLHHGETGIVLISREQKDVLAIPQRAVLEDGDKRYVYVVDKFDVAHRREIVVQSELADLFVVTKGAIRKNDKVVLDGVRRVGDGEKMKYDVVESKDIVSPESVK